MSACKDCLHYEVCKTHLVEGTDMSLEFVEKMMDKVIARSDCEYFKDGSRFIEIPYEEGDS